VTLLGDRRLPHHRYDARVTARDRGVNTIQIGDPDAYSPDFDRINVAPSPS
jgi:hypothetical protein